MHQFQSVNHRRQRCAPKSRENTPSKWAFRVLRMCRAKELDINHADAVAAARIVGHQRAVEYVSKPLPDRRHEDAMYRRVGGSFGSGKRK